MLSESRNPASRRSRRSALRGAAAAAALGLGTASRVAAQGATPGALATHPIVGTWNSVTPAGPAIGIFLPDGTNLVTVPATQAGPNGVEFISTQAGRWEPVSARGVHFTSTQWHSDAQGVFIGSVTVDGYPVVSEDGQTILDDQSHSVVTVRDASGAIVREVPGAGAPPVTGSRMAVSAPGFSLEMPDAGTPTERNDAPTASFCDRVPRA